MSTRARKYLRTDLEVKQGDEPLVDFVEIAEELSPIVCANRHSWLVRRFAAWLPTEQTTNGSKRGGDRQPCLLCRHVACFFLCTAALPGDFLREMKAMKFLKRNFLRQFHGLSVVNWVRKPILVPQWIQFVHLATHFGRCLVRELQLQNTNGRLMLGVCVCLTESFRRYKWHRG